MPNNEMDYSLIHRTPDGNGKILVTTPGSPDKGSWETEAELKTYVNQDVNIAINAINTRVTNIEETLMGENEITVSYPNDGNYSSLMPNRVPLRALKFAEIPTIKGKSRAWNQLLNKDNFPASTTYDNGNLVYTNNGDGSITLRTTATTTADVTIALENVTPAKGAVSGHTYVFKGGASGVRFGTGNGAGISEQGTGYETVITFSSSISMGYVIPSGTTIATAITLYPLLRNLTLYFGGTIPSDASTIAQIQTNYPELLIPSDYDTGTRVDTTYSAVKSVGRNRLKPSAFKSNLISWGGTDNGDGTVSIAASLISGKDVWKNETSNNQISIYLKGSNGSDYSNLRIFYTDGTYDAGVRIYSTGGWTLSNANKRVDRIQGEWTSGTTTFVIDSCGIFLGSVNTWSDYFEDTLSLPTPVTGKSAGSVHQIYYPETGEMTEPLGEVDMGTLSWTCDGTFLEAYVTGKKIGINELLCPRYVTSYVRYATQMVDGQIRGHAASTLVTVKDSSKIDPNKTNAENASAFKTAMDGVILLYELATPNPNSQATDPVPYNFLEVEGGGTIETIQTQTPTLDNCLDVTYDIIPQ